MAHLLNVYFTCDWTLRVNFCLSHCHIIIFHFHINRIWSCRHVTSGIFKIRIKFYMYSWRYNSVWGLYDIFWLYVNTVTFYKTQLSSIFLQQDYSLLLVISFIVSCSAIHFSWSFACLFLEVSLNSRNFFSRRSSKSMGSSSSNRELYKERDIFPFSS